MSNKLKTIPLCQLKASKSNVRKTDRSIDIKSLAASIEANGLLENLVVRETDGVYDVIAGGRRLSALKLLVKRKKLDTQHRVACLVLSPGEANITEVSLAENFARLPLHPADQFEAFAALARDYSCDDIASRFGVSPAFVAQRLKLASVSPRLLAEYRSGAMTLEQLTALTLTDDHKAQEGVWFESPYDHLSASDIRRLLTQSQVGADDRRARFIGVADYEAAGGIVIRDLFDDSTEGYLTDSQLLDRLVAGKLEAAAETVRSEGWSWVEVYPDVDVAWLSRFERAEKTVMKLSNKDERRLSKLRRQYDELAAVLEQEEDRGVSAELDRISAEIAHLQSKQEVWQEEAKASAGAIVSLDWRGDLHVSRGLVRPEHTSGPSPSEATKVGAKRPTSGYANSVVFELSAHRTAVLRAVVAASPDLALAAVVHALAGQLLYRSQANGCLAITGQEVHLDRASDSVLTSKAGVAFLAQHEVWLKQLPEPDALWEWVCAKGREEQLALLAHCTALTIDALDRPGSNAEYDWAFLARTAAIDMRDWWEPTADGFFSRLTKKEIAAAVAEGTSTQKARGLDGNSKGQMAERAQALLVETRWLPYPLRSELP